MGTLVTKSKYVENCKRIWVCLNVHIYKNCALRVLFGKHIYYRVCIFMAENQCVFLWQKITNWAMVTTLFCELSSRQPNVILKGKKGFLNKNTSHVPKLLAPDPWWHCL